MLGNKRGMKVDLHINLTPKSSLQCFGEGTSKTLVGDIVPLYSAMKALHRLVRCYRNEARLSTIGIILH